MELGKSFLSRSGPITTTFFIPLKSSLVMKRPFAISKLLTVRKFGVIPEIELLVVLAPNCMISFEVICGATFFIDGTTFLPIEKNTLSTSLELFTISNEKKFSNYFTTKHFDLLKNQTSNIKTLQKCFIIGNDENYYHNLILYLPKILFLINNTNLINKVDNIVFNKNLPKKFIKFIDEILKLKKIKKNLILINEKLYLFENSFTCPLLSFSLNNFN